MFEVGFTELLVIFVLALVVLGPEKLPRLAQQVGRWIGRARSMAKQFREQLEEEVNVADMKKWEQQATKPTPAPEPTSTAADPGTSAAAEAASGNETATTTPETPAATGTSEAHPATGAPEGHAAADASEYAQTPRSEAHPSFVDGHYSGPPPEPEASVYQPPAYASTSPSSNGSTPHAASTEASHAVESPPIHEPVPATDEPPARPGDVITHTHERGI